MKTAGSRRLLLGAMMAAIVLLSIEVMLQAFYYVRVGAFLFERITPPLCEPDPLRCYRMKSNLAYEFRSHEFSSMIYTNSQGMRTDERRLDVSYQKEPDSYRVLVLGPSFAFGWGSDHEETFAARLASRLAVRGKRVELINLGTIGQGHEPQLCWLREEGWRFAPDLVLVTVYGGEVPPLPTGCPERLSCPYISEEGRLYAQRPTLARRLVSSTKQLATVFYGFHLYHALLPTPSDDAVGLGKELYSEQERARPDPSELAEAYEGYLEFARSVLGPGVEVTFLFIPVSYVVHPEDAPRWSHITDPSPGRARERIAEGVAALKARQLPIVDTTPALIAGASRERLYYWLDIHMTPAGNRIVADAALPLLQARVAEQEAGPSRLPALNPPGE